MHNYRDEILAAKLLWQASKHAFFFSHLAKGMTICILLSHLVIVVCTLVKRFDIIILLKLKNAKQ